jgi:hypothetical protein
MDMQEQRRLCHVAGATVTAAAKNAHFTEHIIRVLGEELQDPAWPLIYMDICGETWEHHGSHDALEVTWARGPIMLGSYRVVSKRTSVWSGAGAPLFYSGGVLVDPTWEDIAVEAECLIRHTDLHDSYFLEAVKVAATDMEQLAAAQSGAVLKLHLRFGC